MALSGWTARDARSAMSSAETLSPTWSTPASRTGRSGRISSICRRRSSESPMLRPRLAGSSTVSASGACHVARASTSAPMVASARRNDSAEGLLGDGGPGVAEPEGGSGTDPPPRAALPGPFPRPYGDGTAVRHPPWGDQHGDGLPAGPRAGRGSPRSVRNVASGSRHLATSPRCGRGRGVPAPPVSQWRRGPPALIPSGGALSGSVADGALAGAADELAVLGQDAARVLGPAA